MLAFDHRHHGCARLSKTYLITLRSECAPKKKSSFKGPFSPDTSPYLLNVHKNQDTFQLILCTQMGEGGAKRYVPEIII